MSTNAEPPPQSSATQPTLAKLATSSLWIVAARWLLRAIGLLSTIILVRILSPQDFGLVALATLVMGLLELLSEAGQRLALIRMRAPERGHYDTAWTLGLALAVAIALGMVAVAPMAAAYFGEPQLEAVIRVLALRPLLFGLENIGTVDFRRDLRFNMELRLLLWPKLASFAVTVTLALWLQSHWALVLGILSGNAASVVVSYLIHPYRPRPSLARLGDIWSMSFWTLVTAAGRFGSERVDEVVIGRSFDASDVGMYSVIGSAAAMPVDELTTPVARALFSGFARLKDDLTALRETYVDALSALYTIAICASLGIAAVADDLVIVLLGERWRAGVPLVAPLAIAAAAIGIGVTNNALVNAVGRPSWVAARTWALAAFLVATMLAVPRTWGLEGIAVARLLATLFVTGVMQVVAARLIGVQASTLLAQFWRPALAGLLMWLAVDRVAGCGLSAPSLRLAIDVAAGGVVFIAVQATAWLAVGRPRGVEAHAVGAARRLVGRRA